MDEEAWGTAADCEDIDMNSAFNLLNLLQEIAVKGGIVFNCFLITKLSL